VLLLVVVGQSLTSVLAGDLGRSEVASNSIPHGTVLHGGSSSCSSPFQYRQIQATELLGKKNPREDYSTLFGGERSRWGFAGALALREGRKRMEKKGLYYFIRCGTHNFR
jgi:hypothetical protein